jgi:hypothetical protein
LVLAIGLFTWWAISISWNIAFLIVAGLYLYGSSRSKRKEGSSEESEQKMNDEHLDGAPAYRIQLKASVGRFAQDFIFVWILMGLLFFYIFSVQMGTGILPQVVFASGNIVVEALLVSYLFKNRDKIKRSQR